MSHDIEQSKGRGLDIILMAKPPEIGEAKTRLSLEIGDKATVKIYSKLLDGRLDAIERSDADGKTIYTYGDKTLLRD